MKFTFNHLIYSVKLGNLFCSFKINNVQQVCVRSGKVSDLTYIKSNIYVLYCLNLYKRSEIIKYLWGFKILKK